MKIYISAFCAIFWAGLIAGISFLEAPLKFQAPGISVKLGLGIGQLVFQALNKIEIVLMVVILICNFKTTLKRQSLVLIIALAIICIADTFWLLPYLDERARAVLQGANPTPSILHIVYIIVEIVKFLCLTGFGILSLKEIRNETRY